MPNARTAGPGSLQNWIGTSSGSGARSMSGGRALRASAIAHLRNHWGRVAAADVEGADDIAACRGDERAGHPLDRDRVAQRVWISRHPERCICLNGRNNSWDEPRGPLPGPERFVEPQGDEAFDPALRHESRREAFRVSLGESVGHWRLQGKARIDRTRAARVHSGRGQQDDPARRDPTEQRRCHAARHSQITPRFRGRDSMACVAGEMDHGVERPVQLVR